MRTHGRTVALTNEGDYAARRLNSDKFTTRPAESDDFNDWHAATGLSCMTAPGYFETHCSDAGLLAFGGMTMTPLSER